MRNKRGISQAFSAAPKGIELRRATLFDVFDMSRILIRSITQLCAADHDNDPDIIARWTANKTPQGIRDWIEGSHDLWLALLNGQPAGVGAISPEGVVSVLYVAPDSIGSGVGAALLARLEAELKEAGHDTGRLDSTTTARGFYLKHGWQTEGTPKAGRYGPCQKMVKPLQP
ncbi:MAG: GNAT family N-acetyltransferase [Ruegeria sp.]